MKHSINLSGILFAVLLVIAAASLNNAVAASVTGNLEVKVFSAGSCAFKTLAPVDFGTYSPLDASDDIDGQGSVIFNCAKGTDYKFYIAGTQTMTATNPSGTVEELPFTLYTDSNRSVSFPVDNTSTLTGTSESASADIEYPVYGKIKAGENVTKGLNFTATLQATLEY